AIVEHIVLAWHVKDILCSATLEDLIEDVGLLGLWELRDVTCMNKERRRSRHRVYAIESNFESRRDILIRLLVIADMAVANLQKAKVGSWQRLAGLRNLCQSFRREYAAADRPK